MDNTAKTKWKAGEPTYVGWLSLPNTFTADGLARLHFDIINVDMQHGLIDYQAAVGMIGAIKNAGNIPFARVPWNEPGIIGKVLDAGAMGIIIPMVNSAAEAKAAVSACRYAPLGARSFGPTAAAIGDPRYFDTANEQVACVPMIETTEALANLDEILAVPGIDAVYVGPADLSITLGLRPGMDNSGTFDEALAKIVAACEKHGVTPGIHASAALAKKRRDGGFQLITISSDRGAMIDGANRDIAVAREGTPVKGDPNRVY